MNKGEVTGKIFAGLLTGGSWMRLAMWVKNGSERELIIKLTHEDSAHWELRLNEHEREVFCGERASFQEVAVLAVAALGKSL